MLKNKKGITITALVITVIILVLLTGVSLSSGYSVVRDIRIGRIISNMALVKAKAETIYEQYQFSGDTTDLIGQEVTIDFLSNEEIAIIQNNAGNNDFSTWKWYEWDASVLKSQGLDANLLGEGQYFYVNYEYGEIIYNKGTSYTTSGTPYFSMSGLNDLYVNK